MAFTTPGESELRCRRDNREISHTHENVAVIKEPAPQPGHAVNQRAMLCGGNSEANGRAGGREKSWTPHYGRPRYLLTRVDGEVVSYRLQLPEFSL